jgi:hypothetical protein
MDGCFYLPCLAYMGISISFFPYSISLALIFVSGSALDFPSSSLSVHDTLLF